MAALSNDAAATELQWRRGGAPAAKAVSKATAKPHSPQPKIANKFRRDSAVRPAAFEDDGNPLQLVYASAGRTTLRSVVVSRDDEFEPIRSAQLPTNDTTDAEPPANGGARFEEQIRTPFGELPQDEPPIPPADEPPIPPMDQPPADQPDIDQELDVEALDLPGEDLMQPGATEPSPADVPFQPQLDTQPPQTFQPPDDDRLPTGLQLAPEPTDAETLAQEERDVQTICSSELANLKASTLADVDLTIIVGGTEGQDFPFECTIDDGTWHPGRCWDETTYMWKASALCHKPLYFEDESLERYGHSWGPCCDPLVSGVHFFTRLPILPYCMGVTPPNECVYALGHYRPGSCAPYMIHAVPISGRGALFQAGAVVGAAAVLP